MSQEGRQGRTTWTHNFRMWLQREVLWRKYMMNYRPVLTERWPPGLQEASSVWSPEVRREGHVKKLGRRGLVGQKPGTTWERRMGRWAGSTHVVPVIDWWAQTLNLGYKQVGEMSPRFVKSCPVCGGNDETSYRSCTEPEQSQQLCPTNSPTVNTLHFETR